MSYLGWDSSFCYIYKILKHKEESLANNQTENSYLAIESSFCSQAFSHYPTEYLIWILLASAHNFPHNKSERKGLQVK